jgi:hypothetical protein
VIDILGASSQVLDQVARIVAGRGVLHGNLRGLRANGRRMTLGTAAALYCILWRDRGLDRFAIYGLKAAIRRPLRRILRRRSRSGSTHVKGES